jgi:hypothetical protein
MDDIDASPYEKQTRPRSKPARHYSRNHESRSVEPDFFVTVGSKGRSCADTPGSATVERPGLSSQSSALTLGGVALATPR